MEVLVFDQEFLVDLCGFLKVRAQVVQSRHAELVLNAAAEARMQIHDFILIPKLLRQLEKQTHLERAIFNTFFSLSLRFAVLTERVKAASLVDVDLLVLISTLD